MVSEEPISTKLQARIQQLQPETRRVATWAMPPAPLFGELCSLTAGALGVEQPVIDPAVSVEFFRAFGLTRVSLLSQPTSQHPADASALLLAGDQFLSICFEQFTRHEDHPTTLMTGVPTLVSAAQLIGIRHSAETLHETVVAAETGSLALALAGVLAGIDPSTDKYTQLQQAGSHLGIALASLQPEPNAAVSQAAANKQPQPHRTALVGSLSGSDSGDRISNRLMAAEDHLVSVSPTLASALADFFDQRSMNSSQGIVRDNP